MNDVELMQAMDRGFAALRAEMRERIDDLKEAGAATRVELVARLERIETDTRATNGRVTRHDEQIRTLFRTRHEAPAPAEATSDRENRRITQRDVWLLIAGGTGAVTLIRFITAIAHAVAAGHP